MSVSVFVLDKLATALQATGLSVELSTGGRTKFNRHQLDIPKTHALDAACVGEVSAVTGWQRPTLIVQCTGCGSYQSTLLNQFGFTRGFMMRKKKVHGFQTGDLVRADVPKGKNAGQHQGRVAVRERGSLNIQTSLAKVTDGSYRYCKILQHADGYGYHWQPTAVLSSTPQRQSPRPSAPR